MNVGWMHPASSPSPPLLGCRVGENSSTNCSSSSKSGDDDAANDSEKLEDQGDMQSVLVHFPGSNDDMERGVERQQQ